MNYQGWYEIKSNRELCPNVFEMKLTGDTSCIKNSGQFINIKCDGLYLRRPISICEYSEGELTIIYKVVGKGTTQMSKMKPGEKLDCLVGLGNGFTIKDEKKSVVIGGGVGVPPLYQLCKDLIASGKSVSAVLGFNTKSEVFYEEEFKKLGVNVVVTTVDGSYGMKGFVTNALPTLDYEYYYTCGPQAMLKAIHKSETHPGQLSFEERMGCGFGACMGCTCKTLYGNKRICLDGPILESEEVRWED